MILLYHFWAYSQKNQSQHTEEAPVHTRLLRHNSQQLGYEANLGAH
jgi:hypothetical protein